MPRAWPPCSSLPGRSRGSSRRPRRSILFLSVTAEEKGLLGSKFYAAAPLYPLEKTLADINLDVINLWGRTSDLISIGMGQSALDDLLVEVARARGRTVGPDAEPEKGYYYRSDHFEFAKQGVPALDPKAGRNYIDKPADYAKKKQDEYTEKDYHKVSDEVKPDWDLSGRRRGPEGHPRGRLSRGRGGPLPRMEAGQRVSRPPRGDAQGRGPLSAGRTAFVAGPGDRGEQSAWRMRWEPRWGLLSLILAGAAILAAWVDWRTGWITPAFDLVAHQFYEIPMLAAIRRPSQLLLVRCHLAIGAALLVLGLAIFPRLGRSGRAWLAIFWVGYAIRATVWICGGNLPLVPGDSCHYLEVATSVYRGEGPVKHYVESFFTDYPRIRQGQGVLDDWATPLDAYVRAGGVPAGRRRAGTVARGHGRRGQGVQLRDQPAGPAGPLLLRPTAVRDQGGAGGHGRAGRAAGARDLRRFRAPREPGRADGARSRSGA